MTGTTDHVLLAAVVFLALHVVPSTPLRAAAIRTLGANGYRALFSAVSILGIVWLVAAYRAAPVEELWPRVEWTRWLAVLVMPLAFVLFVGGITSPNPGIAGMERMAARNPGTRSPATGVLTITRHPLFWSFALWGIVHLLAKGDRASLWFFGSLILLSLAGMALIDWRKREEMGAVYGPFLMRTSAVPFLAAMEGRVAIDWPGLGLWRLGLAALLYALFLLGHEHIFGVGPFLG